VEIKKFDTREINSNQYTEDSINSFAIRELFNARSLDGPMSPFAIPLYEIILNMNTRRVKRFDAPNLRVVFDKEGIQIKTNMVTRTKNRMDLENTQITNGDFRAKYGDFIKELSSEMTINPEVRQFITDVEMIRIDCETHNTRLPKVGMEVFHSNEKKINRYIQRYAEEQMKTLPDILRKQTTEPWEVSVDSYCGYSEAKMSCIIRHRDNPGEDLIDMNVNLHVNDGYVDRSTINEKLFHREDLIVEFNSKPHLRIDPCKFDQSEFLKSLWGLKGRLYKDLAEDLESSLKNVERYEQTLRRLEDVYNRGAIICKKRYETIITDMTMASNIAQVF